MKPPSSKSVKATARAFFKRSAEPKPGEWINRQDFGQVVRLTPLVSIDLVIRAPDGRALVGRRRHEPAKNQFFVPGGRITKNETRAAAFQRLMRDELGLEWRIEQARFLGVFDHLYRENRLEHAGFGTHYVVLAYEVVLPVKPPSLPLDQHGEYVWKTDAELVAWNEVHEYTKAYFRNAAVIQTPSPPPSNRGTAA